jgi:hypothetical protein
LTYSSLAAPAKKRQRMTPASVPSDGPASKGRPLPFDNLSNRTAKTAANKQLSRPKRPKSYNPYKTPIFVVRWSTNGRADSG